MTTQHTFAAETHPAETIEFLATYTAQTEAQAAAATLRTRFDELSLSELELGQRDDVMNAMALNQRAELNDSVGALSGPMIRGALVWGLAGLVVGAVLALPVLLFVDWPNGQSALFVAAVAAVGALAVASATVIIGASRQPQKEGALTPEDPWAVVRVTADADAEERVRAALVDTGARSVREVEESSVPLDLAEVETPRASGGQPPSDSWPASQRGAQTG